MGIHGLAKLIADRAPGAIKEQDIKNYFGHYYGFYLLGCLEFDIPSHECDDDLTSLLLK